MTVRSTKASTSTKPISQATPAEARKRELREQARREIPALRRQAEQGIATLHRLAQRAAS
jgi:hypothetical protein